MKSAWLFRLYPRAWRRRYEEEYLSLLEQIPLSGGVVWDILTGALDAHLHPRRFRALNKRRAGWVTVCLLFFVLSLPPIRLTTKDRSPALPPAIRA